MKFGVVALFFALFVPMFANEYEGVFADSVNPGKCVYGGLILEPGKNAKPKGRCERFECGDKDGSGTVQGCGLEEIDPPCKLGEFIDSEAPYPDCCKKQTICPK